jgi:hypothetical protein
LTLINSRIPGFDFFVRHYNNFNRFLGKKLDNIAKSNDIDIIHSIGPPDDLGYISKNYSTRPVVHEVYDAASLYDQSSYGNWIKGRFIEKVGLDTRLRKRLIEKGLFWEKYIHENADGLVYTSQYMLDAVKKLYDISCENIIIPNAVLKKDIPTQNIQKLSESDGETHTVYTGNISLYEGHRNVLPILTNIAQENIHVHIYRIYDAAVSLAIERIAKNNPYLHIHEPLKYSDLLTELTKYDYGLVLLAPFNERLLDVAIPNKLYEYLVSDLPVIVSPYHSLIDFVKKRKCGFDLRDIKDIHSKINKKYYIGNKDEYTLEYHIPKLIKLYESLVN